MTQEYTFTERLTIPVTRRYLLSLPRDYHAEQHKRWPLVLFLHGAGERGEDLQALTCHGLPRLVEEGQDFPFLMVARAEQKCSDLFQQRQKYCAKGDATVIEKMRFGIIGAGVIGPLHASAISSLPEAELVAVADVIPERAHKMAATYSIHAYTSIQEMLDKEQLDVVSVCTPSGLHGEHACMVMRSGRHVIVERPMEIRRAAMDEMLKVQAEYKVKLAVISQHRFDASTQQVHQLLEEQAFGKLVMSNALVPWWRSPDYYDSGAWRGTWELDGGGVLMNQSIHSIDVLQWLIGRVKSIYAYTDTLAHHMETEDVAVAVLRFANGVLGTIAATTGAYPGTGVRIEVYGDKGTAIIEADELSYLHLVCDEREETRASGAAAKIAQAEAATVVSAASNHVALLANSHALQLADMIRAIREDGTPLVDGYAARHPVDIILGIYESARIGKEVILS
jgi:Predicted dehydrogenases and related proteins